MSEEINSPDFNGSENQNNETENDSEIKKRHIIRKKLVGKFRVSPKSDEKSETKKEINEVLSNLYGDKSELKDVQEITMKETSWFAKIFPVLGATAIFAGIIWVGLFFFPQTSQEQSQVALTIDGPKDLALGATSTYTIYYENKSGVALKNVTLNAYYPEGFIFQKSIPQAENSGHNEWKIDDLDPYEKGNILVSGLTYGSINEQKSWRVFLNYSPANFNSDLQKAATLTTVISSSPLKLAITGPDKASVGPDVSYIFSLQGSANVKGSLSIEPIVPANFSISSSTPNLDKKTGRWTITSSNTSAKNYTITGKFTSAPEDQPALNGKVLLSQNGEQEFEIASAKITTEILKSEVSITLAINGTTSDFDSKPGDLLNISVRVKNSGAKEISDIVPKITFSAPSNKRVSILKFSDLVDKNDNTLVGEQIDDATRRGIISWNKSQISSLQTLKPNAEVIIDIQLPIKNAAEYDLSTIKNSSLEATAEIKFKDANRSTQTIATKPINITLNSDLSFSTDDNVDKLPAGGEKHTVNWVIKNNFHKLKDVKIEATTFGNTKFSLLDKAAGELTFDPDQNKITWLIPEMPEEADVLNCSFSLELGTRNPTQSLLLSKAHLTATDTVTGKTIDLAGEEISLINE